MMEYEGWAPIAHPSAKDGGPTISYRNHNPGNLRSSIFAMGTRGGFAVFYNDATGMFAMRWDLIYKCQNRSRHINAKTATLRELIKVWSAAKGKSLDNYVNFVCKRTGLSPEMNIQELIK